MTRKSNRAFPTTNEAYLQTVAELIVYVNEHLKVPTAQSVVEQAKNRYADDHSLEPMLYGILNDWKVRDRAAFEAFVYSANTVGGGKLAEWYRYHERKLEEPQQRMVATDDGIQEAFNNAMAQAYGFGNADELLGYMRTKGKAITGNRQDQINHALAVLCGFDNIEDFIAAGGMKGRNPKK